MQQQGPAKLSVPEPSNAVPEGGGQRLGALPPPLGRPDGSTPCTQGKKLCGAGGCEHQTDHREVRGERQDIKQHTLTKTINDQIVIIITIIIMITSLSSAVLRVTSVMLVCQIPVGLLLCKKTPKLGL